MPLNPNIATGLIGAGSGIISNLINAGLQNAQQEKQNAYNFQMAQYQNDWNLEQWNRQNAYNSPVQQMARYQEAGLNPNLIYGSSDSAGNANSLQSAQMPSSVGNDFRFSNPIVDSLSAIDSIDQARARNRELELRSQQIESTIKAQDFENGLKLAQTLSELNLPRNIDPERYSDLLFSSMSGKNQVTQQELAMKKFEFENLLPIKQKILGLQEQLSRNELSMKEYEKKVQPLVYQYKFESQRAQAAADFASAYYSNQLGDYQNIENGYADSYFFDNEVLRGYDRTKGYYESLYYPTYLKLRNGEAAWDVKSAMRNYHWKPVKDVMSGVAVGAGLYFGAKSGSKGGFRGASKAPAASGAKVRSYNPNNRVDQYYRSKGLL